MKNIFAASIWRLRFFTTLGLIALACGLVFLERNSITHALGTGNSYYVNCGGSSAGDGSQGRPWNALTSVNSKTFNPGDSIYLMRNTTCTGSLAPQGSGNGMASIHIDAYGTGKLPLINGGKEQAVVKLFNQQYWDISNIETTGGSLYGMYVSGTSKSVLVLHHIHIKNVSVHDVTGTATSKDGGLIIVQQDGQQLFDDIVIDGATAYNTKQWQGIAVLSGVYLGPLGTNVTIQNSTVHDVGGDGIMAYYTQNALTQNNVAYNTGQIVDAAVASDIGTPNAIWDFNCHRCVVQNNEAYNSHSTKQDGGAYDIDYGSDKQTVQYNYGHDNDGYCMAVFSSANQVQTDSIMRYNVCANNDRNPDLAFQGDVYLNSFASGDNDQASMNGLQIYNNTFYWNPVNGDGPLFNAQAAIFSGSSPDFFKNNVIYATQSKMIDVPNRQVQLDNNIYWTAGSSGLTWVYNGQTYSTLSSYQQGSKQDSNSKFTDPKLSDPSYHRTGRPSTSFIPQAGSPAINTGTIVGSDMGGQDFFGNPLKQKKSHNIGAYDK